VRLFDDRTITNINIIIDITKHCKYIKYILSITFLFQSPYPQLWVSHSRGDFRRAEFPSAHDHTVRLLDEYIKVVGRVYLDKCTTFPLLNSVKPVGIPFSVNCIDLFHQFNVRLGK